MFKWVGRIVKYKEWSDLDRNINSFKYLKKIVNSFLRLDDFSTKKARDFNILVKRYKLDDDKLNQNGKSLLLLSGLCLLLAFLMMGYAVYSFIMERLPPTMISFCIALIMCSLAFRYHFYYTLIKYKRLNCNIKDWFILNFKKE